jgi:hypothetical protein
MLRDIPVDDPACADLEHDEDIEHAEADRHGREEVAGQDRVRMIPAKVAPR